MGNRVVYGLGLIGEESAAGYKAYHFDFRGSTVALSDASGAVLERFRYSAYGVLLSGDASVTPFLFNGMYGVMTDGNGLYHMRARFYSAEIRRFLNRDVLLGSAAEGQSLNRFAYVTGRPIGFVDPWGLVLVISDPDIQNVIDYLSGSSVTAKSIIDSLKESDEVYELKFKEAVAPITINKTSFFDFDFLKNRAYASENSTMEDFTTWHCIDPARAVGHELVHLGSIETYGIYIELFRSSFNHSYSIDIENKIMEECLGEDSIDRGGKYKENLADLSRPGRPSSMCK